MFHVLVFMGIHVCGINMHKRVGGEAKCAKGEEDEVIYFRLKKVLRYLISSYSHILLRKTQ